MRWIIRIVAIVVLLAMLTGGYCVYRGLTDSIHAEYVLHAAIMTIELIDEHVTSHDGAWPRSWADLEALPPRERPGMFDWPQESAKVQQYVAVDFSADPQRLAQQSVDEFDAVRPIGPYYPFKDYGGIKALIEHVREQASKR